VVDFTLTDEQKDIRQLAHDFAEKEIRPVAWDLDKDSTFPREIIDKAWDVGLMNSHIPEEYGGPGLDYLTGCLIEEELGWGCSGVGTSLMCNGLATAPVLIGGSEETKKEFLGRLIEEPRLASFCLTEPDAGSGWQTDTDGLRLGVHERGPGPGDTASLPYFTVTDLAATLERVGELGGSIIHPGERWAVCRDSEGSPFALAADT